MIRRFHCSYFFIFFQVFLLFKLSKNYENDFDGFFFTVYNSKDTNSKDIIHIDTPLGEHLTINFSEPSDNMIKSETSGDYIIANLSSTSFHNNSFFSKVCYGKNKIIEILKRNSEESFIYHSDKLDISDRFIFCYSTTVKNYDGKNSKAIMTYWVEKENNNKYNHKCIFFDLNTEKFSHKIYTLYSSVSFDISKKFPTYCTTFREIDILCSFYDPNLNNQFVIDSSKILLESQKTPSISFVLSDIGQIEGKNMKLISLIVFYGKD
jgi:hypothetical protein